MRRISRIVLAALLVFPLINLCAQKNGNTEDLLEKYAGFFERHLPLESLQEYRAIYYSFLYTQKNDTVLFGNLYGAAGERLEQLRLTALGNLNERINSADVKMDELRTRNPGNGQIDELYRSFLEYKAELEEAGYTQDDGRLNEIDAVYSSMVVRSFFEPDESQIAQREDYPAAASEETARIDETAKIDEIEEIAKIEETAKIEEAGYVEDDGRLNEIDAVYSTMVVLPSPEPDSGEYWIVQRGDYLAAIAGKALGDSHFWKWIYQANRAAFPNPQNPALIRPGMRLLIPKIEYQDYTVKRGETLAGIAGKLYGDARYWTWISAMNQNIFAMPGRSTLIYPGMKLRLPVLPNN
jgi:nucleoid-associated protein YgaU